MKRGIRMNHGIVKYSDFISSNLWQLFPLINVDKVSEIPCDYPGPMGVPITVLAKLNPDQFEILGLIRPRIEGKELYRRIVVRNLNPSLPPEIDLDNELKKCGVTIEYELLKGE